MQGGREKRTYANGSVEGATCSTNPLFPPVVGGKEILGGSATLQTSACVSPNCFRRASENNGLYRYKVVGLFLARSGSATPITGRPPPPRRTMMSRPWLAHYDPDVPHDIEIPPIALPELLAQAGVSRKYERVGLVDTLGRKTSKFVHRLLAETYLPNPDPVTHIQVNHKNGKKTGQ
jgi:hypothetical protein